MPLVTIRGPTSRGGGRRERPRAEAELFEQVQSELRGLAHGAMRRERPGHTLQTTALINEAYLKLAGGGPGEWQDRAHFLHTAARAMRQVLVDHARRRAAHKRGSGRRVEWWGEPATLAGDQLDLALQVHDALQGLETIDARACRVVELRFFGGLELEEVGRLLEVSERTVRRDWRFARAWLHDAMR